MPSADRPKVKHISERLVTSSFSQRGNSAIGVPVPPRWLLTHVAVVSLFRFVPSFLRLGAWNVMMFVTYEQLKRALMKVQILRESPF